MASGLTIDLGDYRASLERLLELLDLSSIQEEQEARRRGAATGSKSASASSTYNEMCGLAPSRILARSGTRAVRQRDDPLPAARLGAGRDGDVSCTGRATRLRGRRSSPTSSEWTSTTSRSCTATLPSPSSGWTLHGSRPLTVGAHRALERRAEGDREGAAIVAHQLEVSEADLEFVGGDVQRQRLADRGMGIKDVAFQAHSAHNLPDGMEPGLEATAVFDPPNFSQPGGAHAAVVEVDTETGDARLLRYVAVDDVGNPSTR